MLRIYGDVYSGNCYKIKLLLKQLGRPYEWVHMDVVRKETRTPEFLARNPNGRIPLLEIDDHTYLAESGAILHYLAEGSAFLPADHFAHAQVLQWMFFEQYDHEPNIAVARFWLHLGGTAPDAQALAAKQEGGRRALAAMEGHLASRAFLVAERFTIADIALYAYTHVADEGGFDMNRYPATRDWLGRVAAQPRHLAITA